MSKIAIIAIALIAIIANQFMPPFKSSDTNLFFNTNDMLVRVRLESLAYFEVYSRGYKKGNSLAFVSIL